MNGLKTKCQEQLCGALAIEYLSNVSLLYLMCGSTNEVGRTLIPTVEKIIRACKEIKLPFKDLILDVIGVEGMLAGSFIPGCVDIRYYFDYCCFDLSFLVVLLGTILLLLSIVDSLP